MILYAILNKINFPYFKARGMEESDGFGDFMQGPSNVSASPLDASTIASTNQISANSVSQQNMDSGAPAMSNKAEVVPQPDKKGMR